MIYAFIGNLNEKSVKYERTKGRESKFSMLRKVRLERHIGISSFSFLFFNFWLVLFRPFENFRALLKFIPSPKG